MLKELTGDLFDRKEIIAREQEMERKRKEDNQNQNFDFETSKQQLSKAAELCLKLAEQLDSKSLCQQPKSSEHNKLKSENQQLKQQLGEVIDANLHWQKYNVERDNYVISLQNALKSKQTQKCACASREPADVLTEAQQNEVDKILLNAKAKTSSIEKEKEQLQDSIRDLRLTIHQKNQEIENLQKSAAMSQDHHRSSNRSNDDDYVNMLKEQIRAVTEDFEAERRDREEAHSKILELEIQLRQLRNSRSNFQFYHQGNTVVDG
ncbi:TNFAIP3-interacting protein 2-like isoform X2 [Lingula anatina]|uniref:TNFAIP3-interacting protein 2-like isoform X2 n=1 Tax=Lingula anatina TaxID=7574 RepID=A0A1S3JNP9_LINAN|nr:TNFAIP3-interacting protein 2-like isoform X2 [Lingula anatina]|eukprot:XP_013411594.1 TNFAIP3-interacting protein 2-like isoform X2 [Lingula anatina]